MSSNNHSTSGPKRHWDNSKHPTPAFTGSRKRPRPSKFLPAWKQALDLPKFLDAAASVSISTFGARRLPEIKQLYQQTTNNKKEDGDWYQYDPQKPLPTTDALKSTGGKTSNRHLRRRTTSHNGRKRHRYPAGKQQETRAGADKGEPCGVLASENDSTVITPSRRALRKHKSSLCFSHETWWRTGATTMSLDVTTQTKDHWMATHLWHAKRFHMAPLWGWQVPMMHTNRGAKAALRLVREGKTLLQDVTWKMAQQPILWRVNLAADDSSNETKTDTTLLPLVQQSIQRLCPEFVLVFSDDSTNSGNDAPRAARDVTTGQGMLYQMDGFPHQPIGPVSWLVSRKMPLMMQGETTSTCSGGGGGAEESKNLPSLCLFLYFWVHPAVHSMAVKAFSELFDDNDNLPESLISRGLMQVGFGKDCGMARLQLRGCQATTTLHSILKPLDKMVDQVRHDNNTDDGPRVLGDAQLHVSVAHGTAFLVQANAVTADDNQSAIPSQTDTPSSSNAWIRGSRVLIVSQRLRDPANLPQNAPAGGWDVLCDIQFVNEIFLTLVLSGQACPIGVVEDAYVNLECDPPIAHVFPRDYPETHQGRVYWTCSSSKAEEVEIGSYNNTVACKILRLCLEKGHCGGRVPVADIVKRCTADVLKPLHRRSPKITPERLQKVDWNDLITSTAATDLVAAASDDSGSDSGGDGIDIDPQVIVMRGAFAHPLLDALSGCGKLPPRATDTLSSKKENRRKRRRVKGPDELCHALPLSKPQAAAHREKCLSLLQALSLPAVVPCHVLISGAGTLEPGATIRASVLPGNTAPILGYASEGAFSAVRGVSHGIGMIGAARLLEAITAACEVPHTSMPGVAVIQRQSNIGSSRQVQLQVKISQDGKSRKATLSLLL